MLKTMIETTLSQNHWRSRGKSVLNTDNCSLITGHLPLLTVALVCALGFTTTALFAQDAATDDKAAAAELAKKLSNPVASLISVPSQNN
jgi:hypothetical protein